MGKRICNVDGCPQPHDSKGFCSRHYMVWRRHGDPLWCPPSAAELFWAKVVEQGDCWIWTGSGQRYGKVSIGGRDLLAHRFAYEHMVAEIPEGLTLDHLCQNKKCVNPCHLDPVPQSVNVRRRDLAHDMSSAKTHCPQGHEYTEENTSRRNGRRHCKACDRERQRRNYNRRKAAT
ncbi:HNH endonuclease [Sphaerimonospora mesophila]|uniref:HNH endonuclease n=1 Tax=Sphaerimonospora mesophila TaxID=37483 RepID=UPI000A81A050